MNQTIELEYKPTFDCENDDIIIKVDSKLQDILKKVAITNSKETTQENYGNDVYERYLVKRFITQNYGTPYLMLFNKVLLDSGKATIKATYRHFLYLIRDFKSNTFTQFLTDVSNYGEKKVTIKIDLSDDSATIKEK